MSCSNRDTSLRDLSIMILITGCAWEGGSLRISLSVDSFIYFANIRPDYKWSYFANVIVYCYNRADKEDTAVVFWNYKTGDVRYINPKI